jgi:hypothetical protein
VLSSHPNNVRADSTGLISKATAAAGVGLVCIACIWFFGSTDLLISASLAFDALALTWMGARVSLRPVIASGSQKRHEYAFVFLGVVAFVLVVWQGVRSEAAQAAAERQQSNLTSKISELEKKVVESGSEVTKAVRGLGGTLPSKDRQLTPGQEQRVIAALRRFRAPYAIYAAAGDVESVHLAQQIETLLHRSGWPAASRDIGLTMLHEDLVDGVIVHAPRAMSVQATALRDELQRCGLDTKLKPAADKRFVLINSGLKPRQ